MSTQFSAKRPNGNFSENKELHQTRQYNNHFQEYVGNLPPTLVKSFDKCKKEAQSRTYSQQSQCLRLQKKVQNLERKKDNMDILIEKSEFVNQDMKELEILRIFSEKLESDFKKLYTQIDDHKFRIMQQKNEIVEKQQAIRLLNQESIMLQSQFEFNTKQLAKFQQYKKIKKQQQLLQLNSSNNFSQSYNYKKFQSSRQTPQGNSFGNIRYFDDSKNPLEDDENNNNNVLITQQVDNNKKFKKIDFQQKMEEQSQYMKIKKDILKYQKQNYEKMAQVRRKATNFFELKNLINETFDMQYRKIKKQNASVKPPAKSQYHIDKPVVLKQNSQSQDRLARNVIYDTIKQLIINKITQEELDNMPVPLPQQMIMYESFKQFTPDQLLSLIYANPNYEKFIFHSMEIKMKAINLLQMRLKKSNLQKQTQSYNSHDFNNSSIQNYNQNSINSDIFS